MNKSEQVSSLGHQMSALMGVGQGDLSTEGVAGQVSHWKNGKAFSSQGKVREF